MTRFRPVFFLGVLVLAVATLGATLHAATSTPLNATVSPNFLYNGAGDFGVFGDGLGPYLNGFDGVSCSFGVNGTTAILFTYNSPTRGLRFKFNPASAVFQVSGLPAADFQAQVDLDGINNYGQYYGTSRKNMPVGWTTVHLYIQFYQVDQTTGQNSTYQLDYRYAMVYKASANGPWTISTNPAFFGGALPGVSEDPMLSVFRRRKRVDLGTVHMPIELTLNLQ